MTEKLLNKIESEPVLIVDDEEHIRQVSRGFLQNYGHIGNITEASDGSDALFKIQNNHFSLIIMDLNMPKMDGLAFLKEMRSIPGYRNTAVLVVSGHITEEYFSELLALNVRAFLTKPFGYVVFEEKLETALKLIT